MTPDADSTDDAHSSPLVRLIGFDTLHRPLESWYAFVSRLIRANLLNDLEIRHQLPADWVKWAFAPHEVRASDLAAPSSYVAELRDRELKLRPALWQPFPELSSVPPECLRACRRCLEAGYHSYALQGDMIARCPVHDEPLVHLCPHCSVPLLWQARSPSASAFQCPAGCPLVEGVHSGLHVPHEPQITAALQEHWAWTQELRQSITLASGPVHIAYPPYLAVAPLHMPPLPSAGLLPAMLDALRATGLVLPAFESYHNKSHGQWTLTVQPWAWNEAHAVDENWLESHRGAFRRGVYRTAVPLANRSTFIQWLAASESAHGRWHDGRLEEANHGATFVLPSYLVTNNELTALRRLLARGSNPELACTHYQQVLTDLLDHARLRRMALDELQEPSPHVTVAETFESVVTTAAGHWRVTGRTHGDEDSRGAWQNFREPAEMGSGFVHIMRRNGPR